MGTYLVPTQYIAEAAAYLGENSRDGQSFTPTQGSVLFEDPTRSDAECAALYTGFTATWPDGLDMYERPLPAGVKTHLQHLRDYLAADPSAITNAQTIHVVQDLIRAVHFLNGRLADE